jgi:hypothetical protein
MAALQGAPKKNQNALKDGSFTTLARERRKQVYELLRAARTLQTIK